MFLSDSNIEISQSSSHGIKFLCLTAPNNVPPSAQYVILCLVAILSNVSSNDLKLFNTFLSVHKLSKCSYVFVNIVRIINIVHTMIIIISIMIFFLICN